MGECIRSGNERRLAYQNTNSPPGLELLPLDFFEREPKEQQLKPLSLCSHPDLHHEIKNHTGTVHGLEDKAVKAEYLKGGSPDDLDVHSSGVILIVFGTAPESGLTQDGGSLKLVSQTQIDSKLGGAMATGSEGDVLAWNDMEEK